MRRKKALLALIFAGGMLNAQLPALCDTPPESTNSVIQSIFDDTQIPPDQRAYILLSLAESYLSNSDRTLTEEKFAGKQNRSAGYLNGRHRDGIIISWADRLSLQTTNRETGEGQQSIADSQSKVDENKVPADAAIRKALTLLENVNDKFEKLNLYFIASRLFRKSGDASGIRECDKTFVELFHSCQSASPIDEQEIKAASSILNSMAYGLIPIEIQDRHPLESSMKLATGKTFAENDFQESEKLRLSALAMLDRLPETDHMRRKAHRDLVLWYRELGKIEKSDQQKQILFELVGRKDDNILYPISMICGQPIWWEWPANVLYGFCGMG